MTMSLNQPLGTVPYPFEGMAAHYAGLYLPPGALDRFWSSPLTGVKHIVVAGDSIPQATFIQGTPTVGGMDGYASRLQRALVGALGPCVGQGFFGLWRSGTALAWGNSASEWSIAGAAPTQSVNSGYVVCPHGSGYAIANGAANQFIFTPNTITNPRQVADAVTVAGSATVTSATAAFTLAGDRGARVYGTGIPRDAYIVDVPDGTHITLNTPATSSNGAGALGILGRNPMLGGVQQVDMLWVDGPAFVTQGSSSIDNGATWQALAAPTNPATAVLRKQSLVAANPANVRLRGANAAGTGQILNTIQGCVVYNTAAPTSGFVVHNLGCDGQALTGQGTNLGFLSGAQTGGDPLLLLDNRGVAANASLQPSLLLVDFSNDVLNTFAQQVADMTTLLQRINGYCDALVIAPHEMQRAPFATPAQQASMRAAWRQAAFANGAAVLDMNECFTQLVGASGFQAYAAAGLLGPDQVHLSAKGHFVYASAIQRALLVAAM